MKIEELIEELKKNLKEIIKYSLMWEKEIGASDKLQVRGNINTFVTNSRIIVRNQKLERIRRITLDNFDNLKHYLFIFRDNWQISHPSIISQWDAIEESFNPKSTKLIKKLSLEELAKGIGEIINSLEKYPRDCDIFPLLNRSVNAETGVDFLMLCNLEFLHPFIYQGCSKLFLDGHYAQAVEASVKAVMQYIRDKTLLTEDGDKLITTVFSEKNPILAFSDLSTETLRNEQIGFMSMLQGFVKGVRNVLAHTHGKQEEARKAYEYLFMASLFCRRIDETNKTTP